MRDSQISFPRASQLHPSVRQEVIDIITTVENDHFPKNIAIRIAQGLRTFQQQQDLYNMGRNGDKRKKVTNAMPGSSFHNYGLAIDFVLLYDKEGDGKYEEVSWDTKKDFDKDGKADWGEVVKAFEDKGWEWGGRWRTFVDLPHVQKNFGYSVKQLLQKHQAKDFIPNTTYVKI